MNSTKIAVFIRLLLSLLTFLPLQSSLSDEGYKPIFSKEVLDRADPEGRARLLDLEARNRARWESSRDSAQGQQQSASSPGNQNIYKRVDAKGNVVYGDSAQGKGEETVKLRIKAPDQQSISEHQRILEEQRHALELLDDQKRLEQQKQAEQNKNEAARRKFKRQCAELHNEIEDYKKGGSVYYELDDEGQRIYFTEQQLKEKVAELETKYREHCK